MARRNNTEPRQKYITKNGLNSSWKDGIDIRENMH